MSSDTTCAGLLVGYLQAVDCLKSFAIGTAVIDREISVEQAVDLARLEQEFQASFLEVFGSSLKSAVTSYEFDRLYYPCIQAALVATNGQSFFLLLCLCYST